MPWTRSRRRWSPVALLAVVALILVPHDALREAHTASGAQCRIGLEEVISIAGDEVDRSFVSRVTTGKIFLRRQFAPGEIAVFERSRKGERRDTAFSGTLGREGDGPGEFRAVSGLVTLADGRTAVFGERAFSYFAPSGAWLSTHALPVMPRQNGVVRLPDGGFLISGRMLDRERFGSVAVRVTAEGTPVTWFGLDETEREGPLRGMVVPRQIAYHPAVGVATAKAVAEYAVEIWDLDGQLIRRIHRQPSWFEWPPDLAGAPHGPTHSGPPENQFMGIQFDEQGRLWLLAQVTPPDWRDAFRPDGAVDDTRWRDFMVEVLDPGSGEAQCTDRISDLYLVGGFAGPGLVASYQEDRFGNPTMTFWRLSTEP